MVSNLKRFKILLTIVFFVNFSIYIILKLLFREIPDSIFDITIKIALAAWIALYGIRIFIISKDNKEFYKDPYWIFTIYFVLSFIISMYCIEIIEINPGWIQPNLTVSLVLYLIFVIMKFRKASP